MKTSFAANLLKKIQETLDEVSKKKKEEDISGEIPKNLKAILKNMERMLGLDFFAGVSFFLRSCKQDLPDFNLYFLGRILLDKQILERISFNRADLDSHNYEKLQAQLIDFFMAMNRPTTEQIISFIDIETKKHGLSFPFLEYKEEEKLERPLITKEKMAELLDKIYYVYIRTQFFLSLSPLLTNGLKIGIISRIRPIDQLWFSCGLGSKTALDYLISLGERAAESLKSFQDMEDYNELKLNGLGFFVLGLLSTDFFHRREHLVKMHHFISKNSAIDFSQPALEIKSRSFNVIEIINLLGKPAEDKILHHLQAARNWLIAYGANPPKIGNPIPLFDTEGPLSSEVLILPHPPSEYRSSKCKELKELVGYENWRYGSYIPLGPIPGDIWSVLGYRITFWRDEEIPNNQDQFDSKALPAAANCAAFSWPLQERLSVILTDMPSELTGLIAEYGLLIDKEMLRIIPVNGLSIFKNPILGERGRKELPAVWELCDIASMLMSCFSLHPRYHRGLAVKLWLININAALSLYQNSQEEQDWQRAKQILYQIPEYQFDANDSKKVPITFDDSEHPEVKKILKFERAVRGGMRKTINMEVIEKMQRDIVSLFAPKPIDRRQAAPQEENTCVLS